MTIKLGNLFSDFQGYTNTRCETENLSDRLGIRYHHKECHEYHDEEGHEKIQQSEENNGFALPVETKYTKQRSDKRRR